MMNPRSLSICRNPRPIDPGTPGEGPSRDPLFPFLFITVSILFAARITLYVKFDTYIKTSLFILLSGGQLHTTILWTPVTLATEWLRVTICTVFLRNARK